MDVKPGYRQTEMGTIPEDWIVETLASVSKEPMQNGVFYEPTRKGRGVRIINVGDLYAYIPINWSTLELFDATRSECERYEVKDGDLFFTRSSIVPSGIAHCNVYRSRKTKPVVFDSHVIRLRPNNAKVLPDYLFRYCVGSVARHYLVSRAKTGTMTTIDQTVLGKCPVLLPPLIEQQAIADTLKDTDAYVESLEQLIAKKRKIKQGTMQELLTGKKRLPGFSGEWEVKRLGEVFSISAGKSKSAYIVPGGRYWVVDMGSVSTSGRLIVSKRTNYAGDFLRKGDLVMPKDDIGGGGIIGKVGYIDADETYVLGDHVYRLTATLGNPLFLSYLINGYKTNTALRKKVIGSAQLGLGRKSVDEQAVPFPIHKEQTAIADILNDMDEDISLLEGKLDKARQIKQGMMQELLTGRTRLI